MREREARRCRTGRDGNGDRREAFRNLYAMPHVFRGSIHWVGPVDDHPSPVQSPI